MNLASSDEKKARHHRNASISVFKIITEIKKNPSSWKEREQTQKCVNNNCQKGSSLSSMGGRLKPWKIQQRLRFKF